MPGKIIEKNCENCGNIFKTRRGVYCSVACSNAARDISNETKDKLRVKSREYLLTPEGVANRNLAGPNQITIEDFAVDIPEIKDLRDYDGLDGYARAEDW